MHHRNTILNCFFLRCFFILSASPCNSQTESESVKTSTIHFGISAISVNSIQATVLGFEYPIRDAVYNPESNLFFISGKQQGAQSDQMLVKGFFAAIDKNNSLKWMVESSLYDFELVNNQLIVSNDERSVKINQQAGYDEIKYPGKIVLIVNNANLALLYNNKNKNELICVDLKSGIMKWKAEILAENDWVDYHQINDTTFLILASGIHSVDLNKGLQWSISLSTAVSTLKSLTYSLAKHGTIEKLSKVVHTSFEENLVTQLASNIFVNNKNIIVASKEACMALNENGQEIWNVDLKNYPVSKMMLSHSDSTILLVNFGLAMHSNRFVRWGVPFILELDLKDGKIIHTYDMSKIDNLADFISHDKSIVFAGKYEILYTQPGNPELKTLLSLKQGNYGKFIEFINGNEYYTFKEGYYVPLNFINGNLLYFKTDNNKVYGIDGNYIQYEYHFTELYRELGKFDQKTILRTEKKTILTSENYELMFELLTTAPLYIASEKLYFIEDNRLIILGKEDLH